MKLKLFIKIWGGVCLLLPQFVFAQAPVIELNNMHQQPPADERQSIAQTPSVKNSANDVSSESIDIETVELSIPVVKQSSQNLPVLSQPLVETSATDASSEMFYQLQQLQKEVQELRGIVEQQTFELQKLHQQRLDDYIDLDRRIGSLSSSVKTPSSQTAPSVRTDATTIARQISPDDAAIVPATNIADEQASYDNAYGFLKQRQVDEAMSAFTKHLQQFPNGEYAANALYWLGELHLLKNDTNKAEQQFLDLLKRFPDHRKASDARFKLAKVYFQQGKLNASKELLEKLLAEDNEVSRLAKSFLQSNF